MTDTNQASEDELREMFKTFVDSGYHACYCPRSVDNGCECAIKDEYVDKVMAAIQALIRNEKLKLLAEVRERVVGSRDDEERYRDLSKYKQRKVIIEYEQRIKQLEQLNRLEAEL